MSPFATERELAFTCGVLLLVIGLASVVSNLWVPL